MIFQHKAALLSSAAILFALSPLFAGRTPPRAESPVDVYQRSWEHKALSLQEAIQQATPLASSTFLHTHNSYNSSVYTTAVSYIDPNHVYSIQDQLRMDIRMVELDVHWYFSMEGWPWEWAKKPLLCHGQDSHMGCSSYDRHLSTGINEINSYVRANRNQVIIVYLEDHLDGHNTEAMNIIKGSFGDLIYRTGGSCVDAPITLTRQQILAAGKNVILWSSGCAGGEWGTWVYRKNNNVPEANASSFRSYGDCGSATFSRTEYTRAMIRFYEDRTNMTAWFGGGSGQVTPQNMPEMMKCEVSLPGMDKLTPTDGRLRAAIWSWDVNEPNDYGGSEDCAMQWGNGRWNDANCTARYRFACKDDQGAWVVTRQSGAWNSGDSTCSSETAGRSRFAFPANGYENQKLSEARFAAGASEVWIRLSDSAQEGTWR